MTTPDSKDLSRVALLERARKFMQETPLPYEGDCPGPQSWDELIVHWLADFAEAETRAWQPISTAPKDGKRVMLCCKTGVELCRWIGAPHNHFSIDGFRWVEKPTHWMPLPAPPTDTEADRP